MRGNVEMFWVIAGAVVGGLIVGLFPPEPRWLWSLVGGVFGGLVGLFAGRAAGHASRSLAYRVLGAAAILFFGFGILFLVVGREYITNPRNWDVRTP